MKRQKMKKVKLDFLVDFEELKNKAYVPNAVRIKIVDPQAIYLTGLLGESGRKMVNAGMHFFFTRKLAEKLIKMGVAEKSDKISL